MRTNPYHYTKFPSPLGPLGLIFFKEALSHLFFQNREEARFTQTLKGLQSRTGFPPIYDPNRFYNWENRLNRYFSGERVLFDEPIIFTEGTDLQKKIWGEIAKIPYGTIQSYQAIASRLGETRWARAVGRACASNPIPVIIPCHRVVRQNGLLGGYRYGSQIKQMLLALEGIHFNDTKGEAL